jgi:sugar phosphate isomerase/epimerase
MHHRLVTVASGVALALVITALAGSPPHPSIFAKNNLVAWCIVPFDSAHRGPIERAEMLKRLGITRLAYDWRDKDIPTFDQEIDALKEHGIKLQAFWLTSGLEPEKEKNVSTVLNLLKRRQLKTQIWYLLEPPEEFDRLGQEEKVAQAARSAQYLAGEAAKIGCSVGLYNHGGWFGEPENQLAILQKAGRKNLGMIYSFHHGREQMDRFAEFFPKILPHLMAVNLDGMKKDAPMILNLGEGDRELEMLRIVRDSGYQGPIGILNHREDRDAEVGLRQNMEGLKKLLHELRDEAALKTY